MCVAIMKLQLFFANKVVKIDSDEAFRKPFSIHLLMDNQYIAWKAHATLDK